MPWDLYRIENKQNLNLSTTKIKEIEKNLLRLEKYLSKLKTYYDLKYYEKIINDDIEYGGIRSIKSLFDLSTDEDYYKPIRTNSSFDNNYIEYENKGDEDKNLSIK